MAVNQHDPRPQAVIRTVTGSNATEPRGAYVDRARTSRNIDQEADAVVPARSGSTTLGEITVYEVAGTDHEPGHEAGSADKPHAPNSWAMRTSNGHRYGRDLYANNGAAGQTSFLDNQA